MTAEQYRALAAEYRAAAQRLTEPHKRRAMLYIAEAWLDLAEDAKKKLAREHSSETPQQTD
jgi:hypothetical protein